MIHEKLEASTATDPTPTAGKVFLSFAELAERWGCSMSKLIRMSKNEPFFPAVHRIGSRAKRVRVDDVQRYEATVAAK